MINILQNLNKLKSCTLLTTGRTGSDFLQSLLDSHPQVLTFNGILDFDTFWKQSKCVQSQNIDLSDFIYEFIGRYIEKFKSKYDITERKDQLGTSYDQSLDIDIQQFKKYFLEIMLDGEINSKNCLLAIYGAYAMTLNQDINKKKLFFHHIHHHTLLENYLNDFPDSKIISMTRDPRANFVSGYFNRNKYYPDSMGGAQQYFYIKRILYDSSVLEKFDNQYIGVRIEDLGSKKTITNLAKWLDINYESSMEISSWGGLIWNGDRVSTIKRSGTGFSKRMLENNWDKILTWRDKYTLNFLMNNRLKHYKYQYNKPTFISYFILPLFCFLPMSYEKKIFSVKYIYKLFKEKKIKLLIINYISFIKRVKLFLRFYLLTFRNKPFNCFYLLDE